MKFICVGLILPLISCVEGPGSIVPKTPVERQMVGMLEKFDRWDVNGNGELAANELKEAERLSKHSSREIIDFYDTDDSETLTLREVQKGFGRIDEAEERAKR